VAPDDDPPKGSLIALEPVGDTRKWSVFFTVLGIIWVTSGILGILSVNIYTIFIPSTFIVGGLFILYIAGKDKRWAIYETGIEVPTLLSHEFIPWNEIEDYREEDDPRGLSLIFHTDRAIGTYGSIPCQSIFISAAMPDYNKLASSIRAIVDSNPSKNPIRFRLNPS